MNFCSHCGSERIDLQIPNGDNRPRYCCPDCDTIHYQNPNMVVGCLPLWDKQILLCRRAITPRKGYWNLPAGYLENGETVEAGAIRETWEEARARVDLLRLHTIYNLPKVNQVYLFFLARMRAPEFAEGPESEEVRLFHPEEIPFEEMAFSSSSFAIRQYLTYGEQADQPVHLGSWLPEGHR